MIWEAITEFGGLYFFLLVIGFFVWNGQRKRSIGLASVLFLDTLLISSLKSFFAIPRPAGATEMAHSFPSGHTSKITAMMSYLQEAPWFYALPILVAISRVQLGQHFWQDVVAGLAIGFVEGYVIYNIWKRIPEYRLEKRYRWYLLGLIALLSLLGLYISTGFLYNGYTGALLGLALGYLTEVKTPKGWDTQRMVIGIGGFMLIAYFAYEAGGMYGYLMHYLLGLWISFGCEVADSIIKR
ncbi:phosphatase PAP2 family protein [Candidatus Undinarchaeota archaeon]